MHPSRAWAYELIIGLILCLCSHAQLVSGQNNITAPDEVTALLSIRRRLIDPNGNLTDWNQGDPCTGRWNGVVCYNSTLEDGYLHVQELQLLNRNLSGNLSPALGNLSQLQILSFMWNNISGSIPKEIGNIKTLKLLLLNGNLLTGPLPEELGYLPNLDRIQIDQNQISGQLPKSFANLNKTKHFHMNNNSISGQIPPELSRLPNLVHLLLDNNNLSGFLPPQLSELPNLHILQLDNNNFEGTTIPDSYRNMIQLFKLSLRNCSLQGPVPDLSNIPYLYYIDLSDNKLSGSIPDNKLAENITTIDFSNNQLTGAVPSNFSQLTRLQKLSVANNLLNGTLPTIWQNWTSNGKENRILDFRNNKIGAISGTVDLPQNVSLWLGGNPLCNNGNLAQYCGAENIILDATPDSTSPSVQCQSQSCPPPFEYSPNDPEPCFCAAPLIVEYRLKSPGFSDFRPYRSQFNTYLTTGLSLNIYQLNVTSFTWQEGPRLLMDFKIFPVFDNHSHIFNSSELQRLISMFTGWRIPDSDLFGPYELLDIILLDPYKNVTVVVPSSGLSKAAIAGIVLGSIAGAVTLSAIVTIIILRAHANKYLEVSKRRQASRISMKIDGLRSLSYAELATATNDFHSSTLVGQGGYGKVYKGILADGTVVAIKRAQEGSLQGEKEFLTEIELLSRLHHRNLVSLVGYCDEAGEQMLVYEYMPNGTLREHLSANAKQPLSFSMRLRTALGSAKGILYLHTEADPPIFHRDIKASNILLDSKFTAKVADFGLSKLAPVPDFEGVLPAHVSTVVKGTPGYLDPEYFLTRKLTDKSDVYSLGVVFLELLTGMHPISHGKNIVREVNVAYQSGMIFSIVDERMGSYPSDCVERFVTLAMKCCQDQPDARPTMAEVVRELENIWFMMPESDTKAAESIDSSSGKVVGSTSSTSTSTSITKNPYSSSDVLSGSNLDSGIMPTITPR